MSFSTNNPAVKVRDSRFTFTENNEVVVEDAAVLWTNFGGNPTKYNPSGGKRTFDLVLTEQAAMKLISDGWNVKTVRGKNEGDPEMYITEIGINPGPRTSIFLCEEVNGKKYRYKVRTEDLGMLDYYQYSDIALLVRPYVHGRENSAGSTIKGYLRQMNLVRQEEDYFRDRYAGYADTAGEPFPPGGRPLPGADIDEEAFAAVTADVPFA